jgi:hypothetical protein
VVGYADTVTTSARALAWRRARRLIALLVAIEGGLYMFEMLSTAARVGGGTPGAHVKVVEQILGVTTLVAVRDGNHSTVTTSSWVIPTLVLIPLCLAAALFVATWHPWRRRPDRSEALA